MCGIAGIFSEKKQLLSQIRNMTQAQSHRGPDSEGHVFLGDVPQFFEDVIVNIPDKACLALGHRRLSILDCSEAGIQPMASADQKFWICYNGEVYNYVELRKELEAKGYQFRTGTDTEVILYSYIEWGVESFARFNGMWGLAIWDGVNEQLILSRDRLGVKPLQYTWHEGSLLFASEIKGLLGVDVIKPRLNYAIAIDFLKWSVTDHNNETFFKDIYSFPAGHYAVLRKGDSSLEAKPFWDITKKPNHAHYDNPTTYFKRLFEDSISLRLRSDVEVGACLSGGLDSSSIVCMADEVNKKNGVNAKLNTFHSAFEDERFDERAWVKIVNETIDAKAHFTFPTGKGMEEDLEKILYSQETPFSSASIYAQWKLMELSNHTKVKVLLDGQGADEILCGYRKYFYFYLRGLLKQLQFFRFIKEVILLLRNGDRGFWRWKDGWRYLPSVFKAKIPSLKSYVNNQGMKYWEKSELDLAAPKSITDRQIDDVLKFSVPVLLRYEDRNSMAWSIETRVPFLDYRLVQWAVHAPTEIKLAKGQTKAVLRDSLRGLVPNQILDRRDKMGFVTAQEVWMQNELKEHIPKTLLEVKEQLDCLINTDSILNEFDNWLSGNASLRYQDIFRVYILALWLKVYKVQVN